jgi:hypothetical protein
VGYRGSEDDDALPLFIYQLKSGKPVVTQKYLLFNQSLDDKSETTFHVCYYAPYKVVIVTASTSTELEVLGKKNLFQENSENF